MANVIGLTAQPSPIYSWIPAGVQVFSTGVDAYGRIVTRSATATVMGFLDDGTMWYLISAVGLKHIAERYSFHPLTGIY